MSRVFFQRGFLSLSLWMVALPAVWAETTGEGQAARIYIQETGVYRLGYEDLESSAFLSEEIRNEELCLRQGETVLPLWIDDGGDGRFGPGDVLEFVGRRIHGENKHYFEHALHNIYWLRRDPSCAKRMHEISTHAESESDQRGLFRRQHLEEDRLMIRLRAAEVREDEHADVWFWAKLSLIDKEPFSLDLDLADLNRQSEHPLRLTARFRGLSDADRREPQKHHRVDAYLDGEFLEALEWDGRTLADLTLDIAPKRLHEQARLEFRVPKRFKENGKDALIDVVMLDWVTVEYPHDGSAPRRQARVQLEDRTGGVTLQATDALVAFSSAGGRFASKGAGEVRLDLQPREQEVFLVDQGYYLLPDRIEVDRPSRLRAVDQQSDYLMITHARLLEATRPLAELHRQRGLNINLIDVQDIYDEFSHGVVDPQAIRDFVAHAYHAWQKPRPRFVLLVGDASWDIRHADIDDANYANWTNRQLLLGERFKARTFEPYSEQNSLPHRNLIPTWTFASSEGHSASDNAFVAVDGDDFYPDLAIGRFPVTEPEEVTAIVNKIQRYLETPVVGPWRRSALWITNENTSFQHTSDRMAQQLSRKGFSADKVYPTSTESTNEGHQTHLQDAFNEGQLLVHFYGHGGRHIWRTGAADFKKNHDLFTLQHVEELEPSRRLPLILSMTCYSAPFDHPSADSIGEKFLRVSDRGGIAVFAASWRNNPSRRMSIELVDQLTTPGTPIGIAIQRAKIVSQSQVMVEMYNLLGDPALELALPTLDIDVESQFIDETVRVDARISKAGFHGKAMIEGIDQEGNLIAEQTIEGVGQHLRSTLSMTDEEAERLATVRVYAWDEAAGVDGLGVWQQPEIESGSVVGSSTAKSTP